MDEIQSYLKTPKNDPYDKCQSANLRKDSVILTSRRISYKIIA